LTLFVISRSPPEIAPISDCCRSRLSFDRPESPLAGVSLRFDGGRPFPSFCYTTCVSAVVSHFCLCLSRIYSRTLDDAQVLYVFFLFLSMMEDKKFSASPPVFQFSCTRTPGDPREDPPLLFLPRNDRPLILCLLSVVC